MKELLAPSDFSATNFDRNVHLLEEALGQACETLPRSVFLLQKMKGSFNGPVPTSVEADRMYVPTAPSRFKTTALLRYLTNRETDLTSEVIRQYARAFFAPLAYDPKGTHPTREFLVDQCTHIECLADGEGLAERLADKDRDEKKRWTDIQRLLTLLEHGAERVAEPDSEGNWIVRPHVQDGIGQLFGLSPMHVMDTGCGGYDKVPILWEDWDEKERKRRGFRVVPPAAVRVGACIEPGAVLMPSYVNIGAFVGSGSMVDTWATVGSCAQIGRNVHLSGGVGIGGVLEPVGVRPVIVEDGAFLGSRCIVVEGWQIGKEAVLGAGVTLTSGTHVYDMTGSAPRDIRLPDGTQDASKVNPEDRILRIPPRSVVISGMRAMKLPAGEAWVQCAYIIGQRKESTNQKTSLNEVLRDFNIAV